MDRRDLIATCLCAGRGEIHTERIPEGKMMDSIEKESALLDEKSNWISNW